MSSESKKQTITKRDLIDAISEESHISPQNVRTVVQSFLDKITKTLAKGDRVEFRDFGIFEVVRRKQKIGRNPRNAAVSIVIPERNTVTFKSGKLMKEVVEKNPDAS